MKAIPSILYLMRADAFAKPGGDLLQMKKYCDHGRRLGVFEGTISCDWNTDFSSFDIIHLSNIDRPVDTFAAYSRAKKADKPFVITTIHHSYREIEFYERNGRVGLLRNLSAITDFRTMEVIRSLLRVRSAPMLLPATLRCMFYGVARAQQVVLKSAERVFVLSEREIDLIKKEILEDVQNMEIVRNGICENSADATGKLDVDGERTIDVLVVGRIEARKNQVVIANALNELGIKGTFVGAKNAMHGAYCRIFDKAIEEGGHKYISHLPSDEVKELMNKSLVHVSASYFEVASLVDLEAYSAGCKVVASKCGSSSEVLREHGYYVDPASIKSIKDNILKAMSDGADSSKMPQRRAAVNSMSWESAALQLSREYKRVLDGVAHE